jgi:hypothetical protein
MLEFIEIAPTEVILVLDVRREVPLQQSQDRQEPALCLVRCHG